MRKSQIQTENSQRDQTSLSVKWHLDTIISLDYLSVCALTWTSVVTVVLQHVVQTQHRSVRPAHRVLEVCLRPSCPLGPGLSCYRSGHAHLPPPPLFSLSDVSQWHQWITHRNTSFLIISVMIMIIKPPRRSRCIISHPLPGKKKQTKKKHLTSSLRDNVRVFGRQWPGLGDLQADAVYIWSPMKTSRSTITCLKGEICAFSKSTHCYLRLAITTGTSGQTQTQLSCWSHVNPS